MKAAVDGSRWALMVGAVASAIWVAGLFTVGSVHDDQLAPVPVQLVEGADWLGDDVDQPLIPVLTDVNPDDVVDRTGHADRVNVLTGNADINLLGSNSASS